MLRKEVCINCINKNAPQDDCWGEDDRHDWDDNYEVLCPRMVKESTSYRRAWCCVPL